MQFFRPARTIRYSRLLPETAMAKRRGIFDLLSSAAVSNMSGNETAAESSPWRYATTSICTVGIVSAILSICTIWKKLTSEKSGFFILMFLVASLDLIFSTAYMVFKWANPESVIFILCEGLAYSASLAADLCTLTLTTQRYIALKWPHKKISDRSKVAIQTFTVFGIFLLSITRFQYTFDEPATSLYIPAWFVDYYNSNVYIYVGTLSNIILPFVLLILMVFFSVHIVLVVLNQHRSNKVSPQLELVRRESSALPPIEQSERRGSVFSTTLSPSTQIQSLFDRRSRHSVVSTLSVVERIQLEQRLAKKEQAESAISLILFLDALFILNQLGYCIYTVATIFRSYNPESDIAHAWESGSDIASDMIECVSHSLNFYFYVKFSKMMKDEFKDFLSRAKKRLTC